MDKEKQQIPSIVLDWDYPDFQVMDDEGNVLHLDNPPNSNKIMIMGWLWCGKEIPNTLYKRQNSESNIYVRVKESS